MKTMKFRFEQGRNPVQHSNSNRIVTKNPAQGKISIFTIFHFSLQIMNENTSNETEKANTDRLTSDSKSSSSEALLDRGPATTVPHVEPVSDSTQHNQSNVPQLENSNCDAKLGTSVALGVGAAPASAPSSESCFTESIPPSRVNAKRKQNDTEGWGFVEKWEPTNSQTASEEDTENDEQPRPAKRARNGLMDEKHAPATVESSTATESMIGEVKAVIDGMIDRVEREWNKSEKHNVRCL